MHYLMATTLLLLRHPGAEDEPITPATLWHSWSWEPVVIGCIALSAALYFIGVARMKQRSPLQISAFTAGILSLVLALNSPLHKLGEVLFSAHMTQHELLMLIAAPLLVMGRPLVPFLWALPQRWRSALGTAARTQPISKTWALLTAPVVAWAFHGFTLWIWHAPSLYQATLESEWIHAAQHTCFLGTALLFWWTLIHGRHGRFSYGAAIAYVFTTMVHSGILGAILTFSTKLWYPIYAGRTTAWGLTPLEDQQLGGLIMWIPAGVVLFCIALALVAAWLGEAERRVALSTTERALRPAATGAHNV